MPCPIAVVGLLVGRDQASVPLHESHLSVGKASHMGLSVVRK